KAEFVILTVIPPKISNHPRGRIRIYESYRPRHSRSTEIQAIGLPDSICTRTELHQRHVGAITLVPARQKRLPVSASDYCVVDRLRSRPRRIRCSSNRVDRIVEAPSSPEPIAHICFLPADCRGLSHKRSYKV